MPDLLTEADADAVVAAAEHLRRRSKRLLADAEVVAWQAAMDTASAAERAHLVAHDPSDPKRCRGGEGCPLATRRR